MKSWLLAFRPKTLTAAVVPIVVASCLAKVELQQFSWLVLNCALLSALCIQIATNLFNDAIDFKKGADTHERIGPKRVTQSGLLSFKQVMLVATLFLLLAIVFGLPLVVRGGWPILVVGLASLFLAYAYTAGPLPLAYTGLGDLFVILFFGVIAVGGVFYLHTEALTTSALVAGLQVGFLATILIAINNLRDIDQDIKASKKTMAVRFGAKFTKYEIYILLNLTVGLGLYWVSRGFVLASLLPLLTLGLIIPRFYRELRKKHQLANYNYLLSTSAKFHLGFGLLMSLGLYLS